MTHLLGVILMVALAITAPRAVAQQTETELLQVIVCEIRELRSAIQQGQVLVPLLESNRRERERGSQQLAGVEEQLRNTRRAVQGSVEAQGSIRSALRELASARRPGSDEKEIQERKESLEIDLKMTERQLPHLQGEEVRLFSEAGQIRARLTRLEEEFDQMQRQMQALATDAHSFCATDSKGE